MKKSEVISTVKEKVEKEDIKVSKKVIEAVTSALYETIVEAVKAGDSVKFNEVTYSLKEVPERSGKIMMGDRKGETWVKPAHTEIGIKASKLLKTV